MQDNYISPKFSIVGEVTTEITERRMIMVRSPNNHLPKELILLYFLFFFPLLI